MELVKIYLEIEAGPSNRILLLHTSRKSLRVGFGLEVSIFISKDEWPPSSPDLNSMDYNVWPNLETRVCAKLHKSLKSLKTSFKKEWVNLPQEDLRNSIIHFRTRFRDVIEKGSYIE